MFRLPRQSCSAQLWRSPRSRTAPTGNVLLSDSPTGRSSLPMCLALATTFRFFIWKEYLKYLIDYFFLGAQCCADQKWKTAGRAQCVDKVCPRKIWPAPRGQEELVCTQFKSNIYRVMIVRAIFCKYTICSRFSTTACHNLVKKPHGKVKLVNNLFKPDAVKKVWQ